MKSNLLVLIAQKSQREGRRISVRTVAGETGLSRYTMYALSRDELHEYPKEVIETLCSYFSCEIGDLLTLQEEATDAA